MTFKENSVLKMEFIYFLFQSPGAGRHFEPQIAMLCPDKGELANKLFHNKFLSSSGKTETFFPNA